MDPDGDQRADHGFDLWHIVGARGRQCAVLIDADLCVELHPDDRLDCGRVGAAAICVGSA